MSCGPLRPGRRGTLTGLAVGGAVLETALVLALAPDAVASAPQLTAPPPFGVFHDLRWVLVFHPSWLTFAFELVAAVLVRGAFVGAMVRLAWPDSGPPRPDWPTALVRGTAFTLAATLLLAPWAAFLFGLAVTPVSWLFPAAIVPLLVLGAVIHRSAVTDGWWRAPTVRTVAWTGFAFLVLSAGGAATALVPPPLALVPAALTGWFNAWAWSSVVGALARSQPARTRFPAAPAMVVGFVTLAVVASTVAFDAVDGGPAPPLNVDDGGERPVLVAGGYSSSWDGRQTDLLPTPFHEVQFSYRGLDGDGDPLPYTAADTHDSLEVLARRMDAQVRALHERTGEPVTVLAQSLGSLVARLYAATLAGPEVERVVLLSPLVRPAGVYYPPRGEDGWGVAGGWLLRGAARAVSWVSPFETGPDLPLVRSLIDHAPVVRDLQTCRVEVGEGTLVLPLAAALSMPVHTDDGLPVLVLPGLHAQFLDPGHAGSTLTAVLEGRVPEGGRAWRWSGRVTAAAAASWHVPRLPLTLPDAWADEAATTTGPDGEPSCEGVAEAARAWVRDRTGEDDRLVISRARTPTAGG